MAAADLLYRVAHHGADLETAMKECDPFDRLDGPDRGHARSIAGAALRNLGRIDWGLAQLVDRPLEDIEPPVLAILRTGCAQLWVQQSPPYAAVSSTVEAARQWRQSRRGGALVNAVLRRASDDHSVFSTAPVTAIWPDWLIARFKAALGAERADALAILQAEEPPIDLTLKPGADTQEWAEQLEAEPLANGSLRMKAGRAMPSLPGYTDGSWWVQDAGATIAAKLMGDVSGKTVLDLCAAPGGKSMQLAAAGANLTAIDISRQRLLSVKENIERTKLPMEVLEADARTWRPEAPVDAILLDAPCSALGILRRHPEGAWRRDPASLARYPEAQTKLVAAAREMLKPGGTLIYCVCTPSPEEGRDINDAALATGAWVRRPILAEEIPGFAYALTAEADVLTAPLAIDASAPQSRENDAEAVDSDVFYIARLEAVG